MSNQQKPKIVQDAPIMRSMMVAPAAPAIRQFEPLAKQSTQPANTTKRAALTWAVNDNAVVPLPSVYMLERTHTTIDGSPSEIAGKIADCLRRESIHVTFDSHEVRLHNISFAEPHRPGSVSNFSTFRSCLQVLAEAQTRENVRFTIRLWKKGSEKVIVEIQKLDGCCFLYCQAAKAILRAAKGQSSPPKRKFALPACVPRESDDVRRSCIESGLEIASSMLKEKRIDAHAMAIDTLLHISKATQKPGFAAHCILCGEFRSTLLSLVECSRLCPSEVPMDDFEKEQAAVMHRNALTIIANCLKALHDSRELQEVLAQQDDLSSLGFLASLVEDVSACNERPHDACEAARCLQPLMRTSESIRRKVLELGAADALDSASHEGVCRHALLESACAKLRCEM